MGRAVPGTNDGPGVSGKGCVVGTSAPSGGIKLVRGSGVGNTDPDEPRETKVPGRRCSLPTNFSRPSRLGWDDLAADAACPTVEP